MANQIGNVAVLGAGTMGAGIAQICAAAGMQVRLRDVSDGVLDKALSGLRAGLDKLVAKGKIDQATVDRTLSAIRPTVDVGEAVGEADVVIEAIPERLDLKLQTFGEVDRLAPSHAVLATNTSSLPVTEIAGVVRDPGRVVGLHFFNPPQRMQLLEIVRAMQTRDETIETARALADRLQKKAILVKDVPGFATSRLGVCIGAEAIRMLEAGVASAEDIDTAMKLGYGHPMGPLELTDLVGLDVRLAILDHLHAEIGEQFRAPPLLRQMVRAGRLGRKTGRGFYEH